LEYRPLLGKGRKANGRAFNLPGEVRRKNYTGRVEMSYYSYVRRGNRDQEKVPSAAGNERKAHAPKKRQYCFLRWVRREKASKR